MLLSTTKQMNKNNKKKKNTQISLSNDHYIITFVCFSVFLLTFVCNFHSSFSSFFKVFSGFVIIGTIKGLRGKIKSKNMLIGPFVQLLYYVELYFIYIKISIVMLGLCHVLLRIQNTFLFPNVYFFYIKYIRSKIHLRIFRHRICF